MLDLDVEANQVVSSEALFSNFGRLRDASMGPDGNLYILTSNQDGRGSPAKNDDKILRIVAITASSPSLLDDETIETGKIEEFDNSSSVQTNETGTWVLIIVIAAGIIIGIVYAIKKTKR